MTVSFLSTESRVSPEADYFVVHPLDDVQEQKCGTEGLARMHLSPSVKLSLLALRGYLILIVGLALYRVVTMVIASTH